MDEIYIGIDYGTNNTVVSYLDDEKKVDVVRLSNVTQFCTPTVLYFETEEEYTIGHAAAQKGLQNPSACVRNFKTDFDNPNKIYEVTAENGESFRLNPKEAAIKFMNKLLREAMQQIAVQCPALEDGYIHSAIVTVPARFNPTAKGVVRAAVRSAIEDCKLMAEPSAAALCYIQTHQQMLNKTILVYDFGGGTFDLSVMTTNQGKCEEVYTDNDSHLGGNDLTKRIVIDLIKRINDDYGQNMPLNPEDYQEGVCTLDKRSYLKNYSALWEQAERTKIDLSRGLPEFRAQANIDVMLNGKLQNTEFTQWYHPESFTDLFHDLIDKTIAMTKDCIETAANKGFLIDHIILAGGSSQIPEVRNRLILLAKEMTQEHQHEIHVALDRETSSLIARGAALTWNEGMVRGLSNSIIGVASQKGMVHFAFHKILDAGVALGEENGTTEKFIIPDRVGRQYSINVYERDPNRPVEDDTIHSATKIDRITISDLPAVKKRTAEIFFALDKDGVLIMRVNILVNGQVVSENHKSYKRSNLFDE
ncbi:MAG: Hsp70 family protein [Oscillospiraceae bacterium]